MGILFWRKPKTVRLTPEQVELLRRADAESAGRTPAELDSEDNMPPTALKQQVAKRNGKGFKNLTFQGNAFESNAMDEINKRFEENDLINKQKR
jgi:hypothetical protein